jgi:Zn-dependent protease with chaperone function
MTIEGYFLDGKTSKRVVARLQLPAHIQTSKKVRVCHLKDGSDIISLEVSELRISSRLGNTPRTLDFPDGQQFVTENNDAIDALVADLSVNSGSVWIHRLESRLSIVMVALLVTVAVVWGVAVYGIPQLAKTIAFNIPQGLIDSSSSDLTLLDKTFFEPSQLDKEQQRRLHNLLDPYIEAYDQSLQDDSESSPRLNFRSGVGANAFALPSGQIVITDDLVNLVEHDYELVAVLFHELGHLEQKHLLRRAIQDTVFTVILFFMIGDSSSLDIISAVPALLADLTYSRDFEREADYYALQQMHLHNIDPSYFASLAENMANNYNSPFSTDQQQSNDQAEEAKEASKASIWEYLSTHPNWQERAQLVEQFKHNQADH